MNVGDILSGSQLLQKVENTQASASAEGRSNKQASKSKEIHSDHYLQTEQAVSPEMLKKEQVKELTAALNKFIAPVHSELKFEFHEKLQEYYVTIVDTTTDEIIKEIPPRKMLDMYASMAELLGFIVDEKM